MDLQGRRVAAFRLCAGTIVAVSVTMGAAGCRRAGDAGAGMDIETRIAPQPVRVGLAIVTVTGVANKLGEPLAGVHVQVEGDMEHPGMAPVFADAAETAPGVYTAKLDLNMPGDWVVLTHIRLADGRKIERQTGVRGVEPK
jgi:hypothetical protein